MKPRIVKDSPFGWVCYGMGKQACGSSIQQAYKKWAFEILVLNLQIPI